VVARQGVVAESLVNVSFCRHSWVLWTVRNKMAIEKHFPKAPSDVMYVAISLLQKWSLLLK
jgi:hypothetical protein